MMAEYLIRGLSHIGIQTTDLQKATDFYIEHLGFHLIYKKTLENGVKCWFVENGGLVLEFVDRGIPCACPDGPIYHVALEVCGIENLVDELRQKGIIPAEIPLGANRNFFPSGIKNIFFEGPCGERIELFELTHD